MIFLLNKKLEFLQEIKKATEDILYINLEEESDKYDELLNKRHEFINKINGINTKIADYKNENIENDEIIMRIKNEINDILRSVIELDNKIKSNTNDLIRDIRNKYYDVEKRIQTSDYSLDEEDKKPLGYFINRKG